MQMKEEQVARKDKKKMTLGACRLQREIRGIGATPNVCTSKLCVISCLVWVFLLSFCFEVGV